MEGPAVFLPTTKPKRQRPPSPCHSERSRGIVLSRSATAFQAVTALHGNHEPQARDLHLVSRRPSFAHAEKFYWLGPWRRQIPEIDSECRQSADPSPTARDFHGALLLLRERLPNERVRFLDFARNDKGKRSCFGLDPFSEGKGSWARTPRKLFVHSERSRGIVLSPPATSA